MGDESDRQLRLRLAEQGDALLAAQAQIRELTAAAAHGSALAALTAEVRALRTPADPAAALNFRDEWDRYERSWSSEPWAPGARSIMVEVLAYFGAKKIADVTPDEWDRHIEKQLVRTTRLGRTPKPGTLNKQLKRTKTFLRWLIARRRIQANPLDGVKFRPDRRGRNTEIQEDGLAKILAVAPPMLRAFVLIAVDVGMRASEIRTLTWRQIDLETGRVRVYWWRTKTKHERFPRLSARAIEALHALPRDIHSNHVFANARRREPYSKSHLWNLWRAACSDARVEPEDPMDERLHIHDGRHTAASRLVRSNVPLPTVMKLLGWRSLQTAQRYLHVNESDLDEAKQKMDAAIRKGPKSAAADLDATLNTCIQTEPFTKTGGPK